MAEDPQRVRFGVAMDQRTGKGISRWSEDEADAPKLELMRRENDGLPKRRTVFQFFGALCLAAVIPSSTVHVEN